MEVMLWQEENHVALEEHARHVTAAFAYAQRISGNP